MLFWTTPRERCRAFMAPAVEVIDVNRLPMGVMLRSKPYRVIQRQFWKSRLADSSGEGSTAGPSSDSRPDPGRRAHRLREARYGIGGAIARVRAVPERSNR